MRTAFLAFVIPDLYGPLTSSKRRGTVCHVSPARCSNVTRSHLISPNLTPKSSNPTNSQDLQPERELLNCQHFYPAMCKLSQPISSRAKPSCSNGFDNSQYSHDCTGQPKLFKHAMGNHRSIANMCFILYPETAEEYVGVQKNLSPDQDTRAEIRRRSRAKRFENCTGRSTTIQNPL